MKSELQKNKQCLNSFGEESSIYSGLEQQSNTQVEQKEKRILSLAIDIPQGRQEVLEIKDTDDIIDVADQFCAKHDLDEDYKQALVQSIREHLFDSKETIEESEVVVSEEENMSAESVVTGKEYPIRENKELIPKRKKMQDRMLQEKKSIDPDKMKQLKEELEVWKKQVEVKIKRGNFFNQPAINEYSKKILEKKGLAKVPAHERLHQTARTKQASQNKIKENNAQLAVSKRPRTKDQKKAEELNSAHFQLLYQKGLRQMKKMEKNTEQAIQERIQKELESASFKPQINSNSRKMV